MRTNWGVVIIDLTILGLAAYTGVWPILVLLFFTGGYTMKSEFKAHPPNADCNGDVNQHFIVCGSLAAYTKAMEERGGDD